MKVLILAAGTGSRLHPLTDDRPKTMLEILGLPIIHYIIGGLLHHGIQDITIVTGHQQKVLTEYLLRAFPGKRLGFLYNPYYQEMNNIYSFHLTAPYFSGHDMLALNADVFCEPDLLREAVYAPLDSMLVDPGKDYSAEATKISLNGKENIIRISKDICREQSRGEYIGILKLSAGSSRLLFQKVGELLHSGMSAWWFIYALNELLPRVAISPVFTRGRIWEEIDSPRDYYNALKLARKIDFSNWRSEI